MINFFSDLNNDPNEKEGIGSISLVALLLKNSLAQRDRLNNLEYNLSKLDKRTDPKNLNDLISKEISQALDKSKKSE